MSETIEIPVVKKTEIQLKAKELKEKRALPEKPGDTVSFKDLLAWLKLLTPEMTEDNRVSMYVYRTNPIIIRQNANPDLDNSIDVLWDGFDSLSEDYFIQNHGGGSYKIIVKDMDKPASVKGGFFNARLNIPMSEHPPKISDWREVDWGNKSNGGFRSWARTQGIIDENNKVITLDKKEKPEGGVASDAVPLVKMMLDYAKGLNETQQTDLKKKLGGEDALSKSMGELMLEKMKQDDPTKQVTMITTLITAMKSMQPEQPKTNDLAMMMPMFMKMMEMQQANSDKQFQLMIEAMRQNKPEPKEEGDDLGRLKSLLELARELKGGGSSREVPISEQIMDLAGKVLPQALQFLTAMQVSNKVAGVVVPPGVNLNGVEPNTSPIAPIGAAQQITGAVEQSMPTPQLTPDEAAKIIEGYGPMIINNLSNPGYEFGELVDRMFGPAVAASVTRYGVDNLMAGAKSVKNFWNEVLSTYGEEHLRKWLGEFVNYKAEIEKLEKEEEEAGA